MGWEWQQSGNHTYLTVPKWQAEGIDIGFTTRHGGVSSAPFDSLNLGLHVGDNSVAVLENRERWLRGRGLAGSEVVVGEQVHGNQVAWVSEKDGGRGIHELETMVPATDGLVTRSTVGLMAFFADCVPLFFYYPDLKAVGIAHAGWKGTARKIGREAIECFEMAGGRTETAWVAIGPSIGPCCYRVDEQVAAQFRSTYRLTPFLHSQEDGHYLLDLWEANRTVLLENGVRPENIEVASVCTSDNPQWFYSHRRDGVRTGRMAGWIKMRSTMFEHDARRVQNIRASKKEGFDGHHFSS